MNNITQEEALIEFEQFISLEESLEKHFCKICSFDNFKIINNFCRYGLHYPTGICQQCGNVQQVEYYTPKVLNIFYKKYYRRIYGPKNPEILFWEQRKGRGPRIFKFISPPSGSRVLEVGCGSGGILSTFKECGSEVLGLDYDEQLLNFAEKQGIATRVGSIEVLSSNELFDIIILSHVLEHVTQPVDFLISIRKHLTKGGVLYIEVPSLEYVCNGGYGGKLDNYWQNAHFIHFTLESLDLTCCKAGFQLIKKNKLISSLWKINELDLEGCTNEGVRYKKSYLYNTKLFNQIQKEKNRLHIYFINQKFLFRKLLVVFLKRFSVLTYFLERVFLIQVFSVVMIVIILCSFLLIR